MQRESEYFEMEGLEGSNSSGGGGIPASPRWNPTKEQISMLENWYKAGIRTPSAEQIQQITARLQAYGHIEGKNVFYWFQNHKARQRQKQKQESLAFFSRCFHNKQPPISPHLLFPPSPNVVCRPYCPGQSELGFHPHYPKMLLPAGGMIKKRQKPADTTFEKLQTSSGAGSYEYSTHLPYNIMTHRAGNYTNHNGLVNHDHDNNTTIKSKQETLSLFPLEPTGVLQTKSPSSSSSLASTSLTPSSSSAINGGYGDHQPYFNFFSGSGCCESD